MKVFIYLATILLITGCVSGFGFWGFGRDAGTVIVQTFNAFDQSLDGENKTMPELANDWIFRRERLSLADDYLRNNRTDILLLQKAQQRSGSPVDADNVILQAGALSGFDIERQIYKEQDEVSDQDMLMIAASPPLKLFSSKYLPPELTVDGDADLNLMASVVEIERLPVLFVNVDVAYKFITNPRQVYERIAALLDSILETKKVCDNRIIIAGTLPGDQSDAAFRGFLDKYDLTDTAPAACSGKAACPTLSPDNELYAKLSGKPLQMRIDKILVSKDTDVLNAGISFNKVYPAPDYIKSFGFEQLTVSTHYGWTVELRFARCSLN